MGLPRVLKWLLIGIVVVGAALFALRSYRALSGPPLHPWHTFVPAELRQSELDAIEIGRASCRERVVVFV